ncbi:uncharacterized protein LOC133902648 [Phragmites australis]|uniref:uncharacterized protein LOC133902648 n=1 Tax=Phragmites australis TaxID=29695 RepID=UPI002D7813DA|nr:uncharacterized protein LOC133902648 [Phragmites australis]
MSPSSGGRRALGEIDLNVAPDSGDRRILGEIDFNLAPSYGGPRALGEIDLNVELEEEMNAELLIGFNHSFGAPDENTFDAGSAPHAENIIFRNEVSNDKRRRIFESLLAKANNGILKRHVTTEISASFGVPIRTIQRIWKQGKDCLDQGILVDVSSGKCRSGRKRIEVDVSGIRDLPLSSRTTLDDLCAHLHVSKGKLLAMKREG